MRRALWGGFGVLAVFAACTSFHSTSTSEPAAEGGTPPAPVDDGGVGAAADAPPPVFVDAANLSHYAQVVLADEPLAYYRLGESEGNDANLGTAGTLPLEVGAMVERGEQGLIAGDPDRAVHLDGHAGGPEKFLTAARSAGVEPATAISLELWFKRDGDSLDDAGNRDQFAYFISYDIKAISPYQSYVMQLNGNNPSLHFASIDDESFTDYAFQNGATYHWVATYDGTDQTMYVNGIQIHTEEHRNGLTYDGNHGLDIGGDTLDSRHVFNGTIDEVAIYGKALTPAQVVAHYTAGTGH